MLLSRCALRGAAPLLLPPSRRNVQHALYFYRDICAPAISRQSTAMTADMADEPTPSAAQVATLPSAPAAGQLVEHNGATYTTVREGHAYILVPPDARTQVDPTAKVKGKPTKVDTEDAGRPQSVFYNPIQQFNRDLSVLAIKAFGEDLLVRRKARSEKLKEKDRNKRAAKKRKLADDAQDEDHEGGVKIPKTSDAQVEGSERNVAAELAPLTSGGAVENSQAGSKEETGPEPQEANDAAAPAKESAQESKSTATLPQRPRFRILDALSATGLRALRYAKEIPFVTSVVANDMSSNAITSMKMNIEHNGLREAIMPNLGDAIGHMYSVAYPPTHSHGPQHINSRYDVVDLDPYGTAAPFIDAALQTVNDGGLLCVTCTDSGVFASTGYCEKTFALYGGMPIKGSHMHEGGLRLIINSVATAAAKHGLDIEPLLSLSIDFYARVFIRVRKSAADVKFLAGKTMLVYGCDNGCGAWATQMIGRNTRQIGKNDNIWYKHTISQAPGVDRLCEHCNSKMHIAGPMWGGPIHNAAFVEKILADLTLADPEVYGTKSRIEGMLSTALEELEINNTVTTYTPPADSTSPQELIPKIPSETLDSHPFFFYPSSLAKVIHCIAPSDAAFRGALRRLGYRATRSHCWRGSIKTDAPWTVLWEIMREWVRQRHPIREGAVKKGTAGWHILQHARPLPPPKENKEKAAENAGGPESSTLR